MKQRSAVPVPLRLHRVAHIGTLVVLAWAPIPLGSGQPGLLALLAMLTWGVALLGLLARALGARPSSHHAEGWPLWPMAAAAGMAVIAGLQRLGAIGQLPAGLAGLLDTPYAFETLVHQLASTTYLGALVLVACNAVTRDEVRRVLATIAISGVVQAAAASVLWATRAQYIFWGQEVAHTGRALGTFLNPDHLSGYLQLALAAGLGLLLSQFGGSSRAANARHAKYRWAEALDFLLSTKMLWRIALVVMVVGLVLTRSRMGNAAFFVALLVVGSLLAWRSLELRRPAMWLVASMLLVDLVILGQWVGLDKLTNRVEQTIVASKAELVGDEGLFQGRKVSEESIQDRLEVPLTALPLVEQRPWFGHGAGNFVLTFAPLKPADRPQYWDHAHNDYVEFAVDTGLVGLVLVVSAALATGWVALRLLSDGHHPLQRGVGVAALAALVSMGTHSIVDFNLQIPANAYTLVVIMGLVWSVRGWPVGARAPSAKTRAADSAESDESSAAPSRQHAPVPRVPAWQGWAAVLAACALLGWMLPEAWRLQQAHSAAALAKVRVDNWASGRWKLPVPQELDNVLASLTRAAEATPDDGDLQAWVGDAHMLLAEVPDLDEAERARRLNLALQHFHRSLELRPDFAQVWASIAVAHHALGEIDGPMQKAWQRAFELGGHDAYVAPMLLELTLARWDYATPAMRAWAQDTFFKGTESQRKAINHLAERHGLAFDAPEAPTPAAPQ